MTNMAVQYKPLVYIYIIIAILSLHSSAVKYEYGKSYKYTYDTKVLFNDHSSRKDSKAQQDVGLHMTMEFDLTPVFQGSEAQLVKLQVTSATLASAHRSGMEGQLLDMVKFPMFFEYMNGVVGSVYAVENDSIFCTNMKKGIISMFQVQTEEGERSELDVSGDCKTTYKISGPTIVKQKLECENLEIAGQHTHNNDVFGILSTSSSTWTYQVQNDVVHSMMGTSEHIATLNLKSTLNLMAVSVQKLTFLSSGPMKDSDKLPGKDYDGAVDHLKQGSNYPISEQLLPSGSEVIACKPNTCIRPQDLLPQIKDSLVSEKIGTVEAAKSFLMMLKAFRNSGKNAIAETLTNPDSAYIITQLLDVGVATQTPAAQKALQELLNFEEATNTVYPLRYLLAAAYSTHPGDYLIKDLLTILKRKPPSAQVKSGTALALGAVVYTFCRDVEQCKDQVVSEYSETVLDFYTKCTTDDCRQLYVGSMGNSGLPQFMATLFTAIESKDSSSMLGFTAVQAFRRIPAQYFGDKEIQSLLKIYHQTERVYDSSVRAAAADLLLNIDPSKSTVLNLMLAAQGDQAQYELSTFLLRKIVDVAKYSPKLRTLLEEIVKDSRVHNYNIWAQKGKSSAFSSLLAETADTNATYALYMEMAKSGVMKKSAMDVNLVGTDALQKALSFGIYASGLESIAGQEPDPEAAEEEPTAGLALKILDVLLPPVEFFRGSGGLMSAVWNAPSDPISALQTSFLLQDHSEKFHLANGLVVDLQVLGAASIDLTGMVSISLWNRNSESLIRNSGALVIEGSMKLDSQIGSAGAVFVAEGEAYIDFATDVDFYEEPFKMCMQMKRPKTSFKHTLNKYERAKKFDRHYKSRVTKTSHIGGVSYFISQKNSEQCKILLANK